VSKLAWPKGLSLSFFTDKNLVVHGMEPDVLTKVKEHGFEVVELSFSHDDYFDLMKLNDKKQVENTKAAVEAAGLKIWSLHLPFGHVWDVSLPNDQEVIRDFKILINASVQLGAQVTVIHPSFEPIADEDRPSRLEKGKENLRNLSDYAKEHGVRLGVENLPRSCLGNTSEEMCEILEACGADWLFDTNHSLKEDNIHFLKHMLSKGHVPISLHISDYDFIDERHDLPGCGINKWGEILNLLQKAGYKGPAMYEIRHLVSGKRIVSLDEVADNIEDLLNGRIE